jgi:membrane-bound ClpP family serine protease
VWSATADEAVAPGDRVWVIDVHRLKVRVTPHAPDRLPMRGRCSLSS